MKGTRANGELFPAVLGELEREAGAFFRRTDGNIRMCYTFVFQWNSPVVSYQLSMVQRQERSRSYAWCTLRRLCKTNCPRHPQSSFCHVRMAVHQAFRCQKHIQQYCGQADKMNPGACIHIPFLGMSRMASRHNPHEIARDLDKMSNASRLAP